MNIAIIGSNGRMGQVVCSKLEDKYEIIKIDKTVPIEQALDAEIVIDFSVYDALEAGFSKVVFIIKKAIEHDFKGIKGEKHIILLTDGGENCDESPCTYVINLMKTRDDITIDVIAFNVHDIEANNQLRCTALMTRGKFLSAFSEEDLSKSLFETVGINKDVKGSIKIPAGY